MNIYLLVVDGFSIAYGILILYFLWGWMRLPEFIPSGSKPLTHVSVVIPARNEAAHLELLLNDLADQQYPRDLLEVIVVDDFSSDDTANIAKNYQRLHIKVLSLAEHIDPSAPRTAHKKKAIELAVGQASGSLILTTDADCRIGTAWIATMEACHRETGAEFIAGPVTYFHDASFLGKFQTLDFMSLVGIAASSIRSGFYNLCNGANLAYTKASFLAVDGYADADHTPSGDDMMLMHKIGKMYPGKVVFLRNKQAIVSTYTAEDFRTFWQQRLRWTSKSTDYEDKRITWILVFAYLFNLMLAFNVVAGAFDRSFLHLAMWQFIVKICVDTLFTYNVAHFFRKENLLWSVLPVQVLHVLYIIIIAPAAILGSFEWKDRKF